MNPLNMHTAAVSAHYPSSQPAFRNPRSAHAYAISVGLCLAATLFTGCVSQEQRSTIPNAAAYDAATAEQKALIDRHEPGAQMTPDMVKMAIGAPDEVSETTTASGKQIVWHYYSLSHTGTSFGANSTTALAPGITPTPATGTPLPAGISNSLSAPKIERYRVTFADSHVVDVQRPVQ